MCLFSLSLFDPLLANRTLTLFSRLSSFLSQLPVLDSVIRETLRVHLPIHSRESSRSLSFLAILSKLNPLSLFFPVMRKVVGDLPVPTSLAAPSENSAYLIPKGYYLMAVPGVSMMDKKLWNSAGAWHPTRWTDPAGFAAKAGDQYDNGTQGEELIDYGFGIISKGTMSPYQPFGAGRHRCIGEVSSSKSSSRLWFFLFAS